ncbi:hypothetical protein TYRP_001857 [Tyrophagus putrescentiae]|nr:hypothetical protein TYRP_001857 [Tyrophagus putrescentiae]
MDLTRLNTRVLKEPRGMIRIIQLIFAILAFSTTASFDTTTSFTISCFNQSSSNVNGEIPSYSKTTTYAVEYPFDMTDVPLKYLNGCDEDEVATKKLPIDFSSSAQFFVATGVLCFLYTIGSEFVYVAQAQYYETNPFFPVVDLLVTGIFAIFWLAGASAWATNVSDIKHYTGPRHLIDQLANCNKTVADFTYNCFPESPGKWSTLYISLIFGFANLFLWGSSMWFVYKETMFHRKTLQPQPLGTYPGINQQPGMAQQGQIGQMDPMGQMSQMGQMGQMGQQQQQQLQQQQQQQQAGQYSQYAGQSGY